MEVEMKRIWAVMLAIVLAIAWVSMGAAEDQTTDKMFDGKYIFLRNCAGCHGASGEGVSLFGPPLVGDAFVTAGGSDAIGYVITMGRKYRDKLYPEYCGMPKFQFITGGELQALIDHLTGPIQGPTRPAAERQKS
jgi:mono/diheme cytochrome c family protein